MEDWERKTAANLKHEGESCAGGQRQKQGKAAPTPPAGRSPLGAWRCDTIARRIWNPRVDCQPCAASPVTWLTRCHQRGAQTVGRAAPSWGALVSTCQRESATRPMGGPTAARPSSSDCEALLDNLRWSPLGIEGWRCHSSDHRQQRKNSPTKYRLKWTDPWMRLSQTLITRACPAANVSTLPDSESN